MGEISPFAFEKLQGFKPSQFGALCAKCVYTSASSLPEHSLECESWRLEVSGPGGHKVFEKACGGGGERAISCFDLLSSPETTGFSHKEGLAS